MNNYYDYNNMNVKKKMCKTCRSKQIEHFKTYIIVIIIIVYYTELTYTEFINLHE